LLVTTVFFWKAAYSNTNFVSAAALSEMIQYSIVSTFISSFFSPTVEGSMRSNVRKGNVAVDFLKPISIMGMYFAQDIGCIIGNFFQKFIPIFIFASIFFGPPLPSSFENFVLSIISTALGFLILWFIDAIFGLFYFWVIDLGPIGVIKSLIIDFLSGSFIPLWFFPSQVAAVMKYFPFMYIYQSPISIYIGKTTASQALFILLIQVFWVAVLFLCCYLLQKKAFKNVVVQGG
jgi:ABC-2 type transport system permease protein